MNRLLSFACFCGFLFGAGQSALAEMSFIRDTLDDGTPFILVDGEFSGTDENERFLVEALQHSPTFVTFNSYGGNIASALRMGRLIRTLKIGTLQFRKLECSSACALAFMGGVLRNADPGSIGVHQSSFGDGADLDRDGAVSSVQMMTAEIIGYLIEMGIDPALMQLSLQYDKADVRYLSASEMRQYRVTNFEIDGDSSSPAVSAPSTDSNPPVATAPPIESPESFKIPEPYSGQIRHPKGSVVLRVGPDAKSAGKFRVSNRTRVEIWDDIDRWYKVVINGKSAYAHHSWVMVDQFSPAAFERKRIQIKSFDNFFDAERYVRSSSLELEAYLATNGWFAVTVEGSFFDVQAEKILKNLKAQNQIPDDSFQTYGNTYARRVCCF